MSRLGAVKSGSGIRPLLANPLFRRLFATRLVSQASDGIFQASLASAVLFDPQHQTSAPDVAASLTVVLAPYTLIGPFAGVLLDRWPRQRVLTRGNALRAAIVVITAAAMVTLGGAHPAVYAAALIAISVNRFYLSALSAALPHTVPPTTLVSANSISTTTGTVVTAVGAGIAVGIRVVLGPSDTTDARLALIAAVGYLASTAVARGFGRRALGPETIDSEPLRAQLRRIATGLVDGARHLAHRPPARNAMAVIAAHRLCYGVTTVATLLLYRNYFTSHGLLRAGLPGLAQVLAVGAVGTFAAATVTPAATRWIGKPAWITGNLAVAALAELALGAPYREGTMLVAATVLGFVAQAVKICVDTFVQETVADDYLGRVFSLYDMLFNVTFIVAAVVSAFLLPATGKSYAALAAISTGYAVTAAAYAMAGRTRSTRETAHAAAAGIVTTAP